jgi:TrmH family RNA methyltransferase
MGGHFVLTIDEQQDLCQIAREREDAILAASLQATHRLYDCDLRGKLALMFGNEGAGLSPALSQLATQNFIIPMRGKVESLNVAAAAAVCLFERVRQRAI